MATATGTGERDWDWDRDWDRDWDWDSHQVRWPPQMSDIFSNVASVAGCVAAPKGSALATAAACGTSFANDFDIDSAAWLPGYPGRATPLPVQGVSLMNSKTVN